MIISDELFESFVKCKTKCYLLNIGFDNLHHEFSEWQNILTKNYKKKCLLKLMKDFKRNEYIMGPIFPKEIKNENIRIAFEPSVLASGFNSFPHAIECISEFLKSHPSPVNVNLI